MQLNSRGERTAHQCTGNAGCTAHTSLLQGPYPRQDGHDKFRQSHCSGLPQEAGWHQVTDTVFVSQGDLHVGTGTEHYYQMQAHTGEDECNSRPAFESRTDHSNRVGHEQQGSGEVMVPVGEAHG